VTTHIPSDNTSPDDDDVVVQFPGAAQPATDRAPAPEPDIFAEDALDAITPTEQEDYLIPVDMWPQPVDGAQLLTEIADTLIRNPRIKRVEVQGHTDNSGTPEHNQTLSEQRAEAVRKWLVDHGVAPDRMVAKGYGQTKPLVPNVTAANKAKNRRVQFVILDQDPEQPATKPAPGGAGGAGGGRQPPPF